MNKTEATNLIDTLSRVNAIAKARRLTLNAVLVDARNASCLDSLRALIDAHLDALERTEGGFVKSN